MNHEGFAEFAARVNLLSLFDHSGRAGNSFFLTIFDQHPQVLTCHWVHYVYSYLVTEFGEASLLDSRRAHDFLVKRSYFRYVFRDLDESLARDMSKFGADPASVIDRTEARRAFAEIVLARQTISRRELVLAAYYAFARGLGRDTRPVRHVLAADAVSLRFENILAGFGGAACRAVFVDFPRAKAISLVRDPRANFASNRHQFVNSQGNMYGLRPGGFLAGLGDLYQGRLAMGQGCVYLFWLAYFASAARVMERIKSEQGGLFRTVRNEDLNTNFLPTMQGLCAWLGVDMLEEWARPDYEPTSVGRPWRGTGAYNDRYQTNRHGPLKNDPPQVAAKVTGPNVYVTRRWRSRMSPQEIGLMETLFRDELTALGYEFLRYPQAGGEDRRFRSDLLRPMLGETPRLAWVAEGLALGWREVGRRLHYALAWPVYYAAGRLALARLWRRGFFHAGGGPKGQGPAGGITTEPARAAGKGTSR